ncbi:hypothetical protein [Bradyrhizobium sp. STM 3561]|uniref:hypothetical protein n=1 Tax=Bradyrhizobium sp. STM 3561 TaxID=578923 RepID=UPI003890BB9F
MRHERIEINPAVMDGKPMLWLADECIAASPVREPRAGRDVPYIAEYAASLSDMELRARAARYRH